MGTPSNCEQRHNKDAIALSPGRCQIVIEKTVDVPSLSERLMAYWEDFSEAFFKTQMGTFLVADVCGSEENYRTHVRLLAL